MRAPALNAGDLAARAAAVAKYAPSAKGGAWPHTKVSPQLWGTMLDLIYSGHEEGAWKFLDDRVAAESPRQRCLRARLPRATRQESLLARGQGDEFRKASRWQD